MRDYVPLIDMVVDADFFGEPLSELQRMCITGSIAGLIQLIDKLGLDLVLDTFARRKEALDAPEENRV